MRWNSGFERPALKRRMVTKGQKYSMYRTNTQFDIDVVELEKDKFEETKE
jgi:hypothetical protein